jgi:hypothetical protein
LVGREDAGEMCSGGFEGEEADAAFEEVGEDEDSAAGVEASDAVGADGGEEDGGRGGGGGGMDGVGGEWAAGFYEFCGVLVLLAVKGCGGYLDDFVIE